MRAEPVGIRQAGLALVTSWPGPALFRNVRIEGFDYGLWSTIGQYSQAIEHLALEGQRVAGIGRDLIGIAQTGSDLSPCNRHHLQLADRVRELEEAISSVQTLQGLLPICCYCKKIRDDGNYWHRVENYISGHANVRFSHGICPACLKTLYPEFADRTPPGGSPATPEASATPRPPTDGSTEL